MHLSGRWDDVSTDTVMGSYALSREERVIENKIGLVGVCRFGEAGTYFVCRG